MFDVVAGHHLRKKNSLIALGHSLLEFSMAFNRFRKHAIRSRKYPEGLPGLPKRKQEMVDIGNLLVYVGIALAKAQQSVGHLWTWEQPAYSLQLLFPALLAFFWNARWPTPSHIFVPMAPHGSSL